MRGAQNLLVAALGLPFSSLGTAHAEKVAVAPGHTGGTDKRQDNFQTGDDNHNRQDSENQRRQATATAREEDRSVTAAAAAGTSSTADGTTCSEEGGSRAASCVVEPSTDQAEQQQQHQQEQQQRQLLQQQREQRQQQQQQQQQQREQSQRSGGGGVEVKTGDQDGIRIDFVGTSDGSNPELAPPSPPAAAAKRQASQEEDKLATNEESLTAAAAAAAAAAEMQFGLLRCDGESHRDEKDGGITVKGVCDHMLSKLMESAQRVAPNTGDGLENDATAAAKETLAEARGAIVSAGFGQVLVMATAPMSYVFGVLGGVPGWFSDVVFEVSLKEGETDEDLPRRLLLVQNPPRSLQMACSLLAPSLLRSLGSPATGTAAAAESGAATVLPRLVRTLCSADSPFPGKMVSRPCRMEAAPPTEWVSTTVQAALASVGLGWGGGDGNGNELDDGADSSNSRSSSVGGGVCECEMQRGGACKIRASPGRDPCLYVEEGDISKGGRATRIKGGSGRSSSAESFGADSVDAFSSVELRTLRVSTESMTTESMTTAESQQAAWKGSAGGATKTAVKDTLAALQAAVGKQDLPSSVGIPVYPAKLVAGAVLLFLAKPLSESRLFHYLLSAMLGGVVGATVLLLRTLANPRRAPLRLLLFFGLAMWLAVTVGGDVDLSPGGLLSSLFTWALAFWGDGFDSYPWAGKAFFSISSLAGVLITRWQGLFLDEGDGPRGSCFNGQTCIHRILAVSGVLLVYYGVSDAEVGVALVVLALTVPTMAHYARRYSMWSSSSGWYRAGNKLSQSEYEKQGDEYTRQAMAALRATTSENWPLVKKLKNQASRRRMTAFAQNGEHFASPGEENDTGGGRCSVQ